MSDQRLHERFDPLVCDHRDLDPPGTSSARKKCTFSSVAILVPDPHLAKIVLRKLPRQSFNRTKGVTVRTRSVCANA